MRREHDRERGWCGDPEGHQRGGARRLVGADAPGRHCDDLGQDRHRGDANRVGRGDGEAGCGSHGVQHRGLEQPRAPGGSRHACTDLGRRIDDLPAWGEQPPCQPRGDEQAAGDHHRAPPSYRRDARGRRCNRSDQEKRDEISGPQCHGRDDGVAQGDVAATNRAGHAKRLAQPERQHVVAEQRHVDGRPGLTPGHRRLHRRPCGRPQPRGGRVRQQRQEQRARCGGHGPQGRRQRRPLHDVRQIPHRQHEDGRTDATPQPADARTPRERPGQSGWRRGSAARLRRPGSGHSSGLRLGCPKSGSAPR